MTLRFYNQQLAENLNLRCPVSAPLLSIDDLTAFAERHGFPVVIKADHSVAGQGVKICTNKSETALAWSDLFAKSPDGSLTVQRYIVGTPAMCALSAVDGQVLASLSALKIHVHPVITGPSSVVKFVENAEMLDTAKKMVSALHYSGFISFDFIVEAESQNAWLIECNQRPVPISHLGRLAPEFVKALGGQSQNPVKEVPIGLEMALYPQEWMRLKGGAPASGLQRDIPEDDAPLLAAYTHRLRHSIESS